MLFNTALRQKNFSQNRKYEKKQSYLDIFIFHPLAYQDVFGVYYVQRGLGYNIYVGAKLYILGRAKMFSSVATDFGPSSNHSKYVDEMC